MSVSALLLAAALQASSPSSEPSDCAVFAGFLQEFVARQMESEAEDRIIVRYPFGFSSLSQTSQDNVLDGSARSQLDTFIGVLPAEEELDRSSRIRTARRGERERLYANGVSGNDLLDQVDDFIAREFPYQTEEVHPDPSTLANLSDRPAARIDCAFGEHFPAQTVFAEIGHPDGAWTWIDIGTGERLRGDDVGVYHALAVLAFSEGGSEAILYREEYCGGLCGGGGTIYLMRRAADGQWQIVGWLGDWIT